MVSQQVSKEHLSSLVDGELSSAEVVQLLRQEKDESLLEDWDIYHRIGEQLRSGDQSAEVSNDFLARLRTQLDAEPTVLAPAASRVRQSVMARSWRAMAGAGLAASVAVVMLNVFQAQAVLDVATVDSVPAEMVAAADPVPLQGAPIDDYMHAHHSMAPVFYGAPKYARMPVAVNTTTD